MHAVYDITIHQGETFTLPFKWTGSAGAPVDLTGYTGRMQIRKSVTSDDALITLTTENGGITLNGALGTGEVLITAAQSSAFTWRSGVYDLELEASDGRVKRLLMGAVVVDPEVTR